MRILIISDAWHPQVNGVVRTLSMLQRELTELGHTVEVIGPDRFRTMPLPSYGTIQLAVAPSRRLVPMIEAFRPEALHIATEGPLGWAARRWAIRRGVAFTTSFHTRFPEYLHARARIPVALGYAWLRWFHGSANGTMVATGSLRRELAGRGFRNLRPWSRGVDLDRFRPGRARGLALSAADLPLCRPPRGREEPRRLPLARPAGHQGRGRRRAATGGAAGRISPKRSSSASGTGRSSPAPMPGPTCSCSPRSPTRSAWCCWKAWPAAPRSPPTRSPARPTSWPTPAPASARSTPTCARPRCARCNGDRAACRAHAERFSWRGCAEIFVTNLAKPVKIA